VLKRSARLDDFLRFPVLPYGSQDAIVSSKIETELEKKGIPARRADRMVASVAIGAASPLSTFDLEHFEPMSEFGLRLFG
jgi:predicted nucleic acid-binding protein